MHCIQTGEGRRWLIAFYCGNRNGRGEAGSPPVHGTSYNTPVPHHGRGKESILNINGGL